MVVVVVVVAVVVVVVAAAAAVVVAAREGEEQQGSDLVEESFLAADFARNLLAKFGANNWAKKGIGTS